MVRNTVRKTVRNTRRNTVWNLVRRLAPLACLAFSAASASAQIPTELMGPISRLASVPGGGARVIGDAVVAAVPLEEEGLESRVEAQTRAYAMLLGLFKAARPELETLRADLPAGMPLDACPGASVGRSVDGAIAVYSSPELWRTRRRSGMTVLHRDLGGVTTDFRDTLCHGLLPAPGGELAIDLTGSAAWIAFGLARVEQSADPALKQAALRSARERSRDRARRTLAAVMRGETPPEDVYPTPRLAELARTICEAQAEYRSTLIDDLAGLVVGEGRSLARGIESGEARGVSPLTGEMLDGRWVFTILVRTVPDGAARRQIQRRVSDANPLNG